MIIIIKLHHTTIVYNIGQGKIFHGGEFHHGDWLQLPVYNGNKADQISVKCIVVF